MIVNLATIKMIEEDSDRPDCVDITFQDGGQLVELASALTVYGLGEMLVTRKLHEIAGRAKENSDD